MKNVLLFLLALVLTVATGWSQTVIEDFEDGGKLNWNADGDGQGEFMIIENPAVTDTLADPLGINPDGNSGQYAKEPTAGFSLFRAFLDAPIDISTDNKFTIQFYVPKKVDVIFKLEGPLGGVEDRVTIPVTNLWVEYSFDLSSGADIDSLTSVLMFFDPGVTTEEQDTFIFDNIVQLPADECSGVAEIPGVIDDFDCQRNVPVGGAGFLDITVVPNPDPDEVNGMSNVGQYRDTFGGFHAYVYDYVQPIDFTELTVLKFKVWAPKTGRLLTKLEGGTSPNVERDVQVEATEQWVEYTVDYSDLAGSNYTRLVFFFNAGQPAEPGDIYFLDDFRWEAPPMGDVIEDFEDGTALFWEPLNGDMATHGTFQVIANPDMSGNDSDNVGSYTKGSSPFSTLSATLTDGLDLSEFSQLNLQVWAPGGASQVSMQLVSPTQGNKEVTRDLEATEEWVELNFNFEEFNSITDFSQLNLVFDGGTASNDTYFIDNLSQGSGTVDPCEGVEPIPSIVDDFDCQRNVPAQNADNDINIIDNPDISSPLNNNPLDKVAEYTDPPGAFGNILYNFGDDGIDLSFRNQLRVLIWSPEIVPMGFKLEGGSSPAVEQVVDVPVANEWVEYVIDFSDQAMEDHQSLVLFLNFGNEPSGQVYFIDDISWEPAPYTGCMINFEEPNLTITDWGYFANGTGDAVPEFTYIANPDQGDANPSDSVGVFVENGEGDGVNTFAGLTTRLPAPIALPNGNKTISMKVWGPVAGPQVIKTENGRDGVGQSGDVFAEYTTPGQWQELTWDFTATNPDDALYDRFTIILGFGETPTEQRIWYFDDVEIADSDCAGDATSIFEPVRVEKLAIMPNPVTDQLFVEGAEDISYFEIYNSLGQRQRIVATNSVSRFSIDVATLENGMYVLAAFDRSGALVGNARFVKN